MRDDFYGLPLEMPRPPKKKVGLETFDASSGFDSIFKASVVKSLSITLVRDVDGKTFVNALDGVIARWIQKRTDEEESSLSAFRNSFLGRNLKQGTTIYLTWLEPSRMLETIDSDVLDFQISLFEFVISSVSVSTKDQGPSQVDAEVKSATVNYALYDGFFGSSPVSPTLRSSTAQLLEAILTK
ncbi:fatty-acid-binding protein 3, chloroplastic-like [Aegilops tauschii subsp. strangulata]|uniref:fatty-acid-binding protein 3, chloroplastic-like n=1 Tax=Aegilops tauschii subsp. strangulata TaxID=200361 RepID=UPI00098A6183|nr:fatty-acid-binding protein 3, chloroplastic-like [Aegilops tauschii subsp. strangulata]